MNNIDKLQAIYDAEKNIKLRWFWDAGIHAYIGDNINGYKDHKIFNTLKEAIDWLYEKTVGEK